MLINKQQIFLDLDINNKIDVLKFISEKSREFNITDSSEGVLKDFLKREEEYPTAVAPDFAIPHAKSEHVKEAKLFLIRLNNAIEWDSPDQFKVKVIFGIFVPFSEKGTRHIQILSSIATELMEDEFKESILNSKNEEEVLNLLSVEG